MADNTFKFNIELIKKYISDVKLETIKNELWSLYDSMVKQDVNEYEKCLLNILDILSDHELHGTEQHIKIINLYIELLEWKQLKFKAVINTDINIRLINLIKDIFDYTTTLNSDEQLMLKEIIYICSNTSVSDIPYRLSFQVNALNDNTNGYSDKFILIISDFILSFNQANNE